MKNKLNINELVSDLNEIKFNEIDNGLNFVRFIDKLGDSDSFCKLVNEELNRIKLSIKNQFTDAIQSEIDFKYKYLGYQFEFLWNQFYYDLYINDELYLSTLSKKLVSKIIKDFNVAVLIKLKRAQFD